jgi:hypothetical protein
MSTQTMTDDELEDRASKVLLAAMESASTRRIDPKKWWVRGRAALVVAAAAAETWAHFVSMLGEKLEIDSYNAKSVEGISALAGGMEDPVLFRRFRRLVERDALYIVVMARTMRAQQGAKEEEEEKEVENEKETGQIGLFNSEEE